MQKHRLLEQFVLCLDIWRVVRVGRRSIIGNDVNGLKPVSRVRIPYSPFLYDPLVKWLRHRPFTAVSWVRIPYGSLSWRISSAGRASALQAGCHRFEPCILHNNGFHISLFNSINRIIWLGSSVGRAMD